MQAQQIKIFTCSDKNLYSSLAQGSHLSRDNKEHGVVKLHVDTWVYSKTIQWHIHAGSWSLVNCWREGSTLPYKGCS